MAVAPAIKVTPCALACASASASKIFERLGHLDGGIQAHLVHALSIGHGQRICRVDAVDIGADLAVLRPQGRGEDDGGGVRASASERGDLAGLADTLKAGDDGDHLVQCTPDAVGLHVQYPGSHVVSVRDDARLTPRERLGRLAQVLDGHGQEGHAHALTDADEQVEELPSAGIVRDFSREREEEVARGVSHGAHDHHDVDTGPPRRDDTLSHGANLLHIGHG